MSVFVNYQVLKVCSDDDGDDTAYDNDYAFHMNRPGQRTQGVKKEDYIHI